MFQGYFYHDRNSSARVIMCAIAERSETQQQFGMLSLQQMYSRDTTSGIIIGVLCPCHTIVAHFLGQEDSSNLESYIHENEAYMRENIKSPFLLILSQGSDFGVVSCYAPYDFQFRKLEAGHYSVRDCFITATIDEQLLDQHQRWTSRVCSGQGHADAISSLLKQRLIGYPAHQLVSAQSTTILKESTSLEPMMYSGEVKATDEDKDGIKGPVSQYNFFSMESRKHIRDGSCSIEMSNNEWNRLVGKRWKELTLREHEPFKQMALQDKKRYEAECAAAGITMEKRVKQTAYNHFVHQEKQFVAATNVSNMKHKTGRYCSARWRAMPAEEKELYLVLEKTSSKHA